MFTAVLGVVASEVTMMLMLGKLDPGRFHGQGSTFALLVAIILHTEHLVLLFSYRHMCSTISRNQPWRYVRESPESVTSKNGLAAGQLASPTRNRKKVKRKRVAVRIYQCLEGLGHISRDLA